MIRAGACGLKLHEDWGTTPAAIDSCLAVADQFDVQVMIHTDTLNESGFVEDTIAAFKGRTIHTFHTEGAGGGHAPDIIKVAGLANVLPVLDQPDAALHGQHARRASGHADGLPPPGSARSPRTSPSPKAASARRPSRRRTSCTTSARFSMMSSDSQAMGRVGEVIIRTWQTAHKMKRSAARCPATASGNDNARVKRYIAKYTINPAIAQGMAQRVGSIEAGKLADLVLWSPAFFGVKPDLVIKGGIIACAPMGDPNASIPTPQPVHYRPMFGAFGRALAESCITFVSAAGAGRRDRRGARAAAPPGRGREHARRHRQASMMHNDATPEIEVDAETYEVRADGVLLTCEPAKVLPMAQRYFLF